MSTFVLDGHVSGGSRHIDYARELNQEQLAVVLGGDGPCLVLAGAGSGKTRTLTYRVAYLLEQGIDPSQILLLTFTNKASKEMMARVSALTGTESQGMWGGTFHSIAARLLRSFADALGYEANFSILDADDAVDLVKAIMKDLSIDHKARRFPSPNVCQNILSFARNTQTSVADTLEIKHPTFTPFAGEIEEIARQYQRRKQEANVMDFDDLLTNLTRVLEDPRFGPTVSARFRYVLVDEFQDTNAIQARIVKGFAQAHKNVLVVGDDAQSIYAFRGADVKNILSFPDQWSGCKIFKLLTNYRSTPEILELANDSLSHNREQFQKDLTPVRDKGEKPRLVACASAAQEARFVAEQILELRSQGVALRNIAVLFRSSAHSQALEFECMKRDLPYEYRGGMKFFERAHIKDVVMHLRIYANPKDELAWRRVLSLQTGIGAATASTLTSQFIRVDSLEDVVKQDVGSFLPGRAQSGWRDFAETAQGMLARGQEPAPMVRAILESTYGSYLEREYPDWKERLEDLEQLAVFAETYDTVAAFLGDIALYDDVVARREEAGKGDEERMILSTIHQAKGLEWDTVFVVHLADTAFPNRRALAEEGGMEEERRLFYVAVTRARRLLFLSYPLTLGYDTLMFNQPSTFVDEVSPRLFERVELREAKVGSARATGYGLRETGSDEWSWDEPTINVEKPTATIWKSTTPAKPKLKPGSFLRDIDEL